MCILCGLDSWPVDMGYLKGKFVEFVVWLDVGRRKSEENAKERKGILDAGGMCLGCNVENGEIKC